MFDITINFDDITITSIEKKDIIAIQEWINSQNTNYSNRTLKIKEINERFLEYYVSEGEFFLKIKKSRNLIGILKGRIEFKNSIEVWIWCFVIDSELRSQNIGSRILGEMEKYFNKIYGISTLFTIISNDNSRELKFWERNKFKLQRVSKDFFNVDDNYIDMLILKKI